MRRAAAPALVALLGAAGLARAAGPEPMVQQRVAVDPHDWRDEVVYFVMTDRFADGDPGNDEDVDKAHKGAFHGGDLAGLKGKLPYLRDLGVTALWITPVVEQIDHPVHGAGFPDWGYHGYWAERFDRVEPRLGTEAELKALVEAAHAHGIKVLIDVVLNHPGYGSHFVQDGRWVRSTELGTCAETSDDLVKCLLGLPDFRTEDPAIAEQLIDWQVSWIDRTGCDGFRVDTAKHVSHDVLRRLRVRALAKRPDFFLLGEVWGATQHEPYASEFLGDQMDSLFDFGFHGAVEGFVQGRGRAVAFAAYLQKRHAFPNRPVLAHYLDTHDVPTFLHRLGGDTARMRLAAALQLTTLGIPVITWGNEVGRRGGDWPENRSDMPWGAAQDAGLLAWYKQLIAVRREHKALRRGRFERAHADGDVLAFLRHAADPSGTDAVLVVVHRGTAPAKVTIALPEAVSGIPSWQDALAPDGPALALSKGGLPVPLAPLTARILVPGP